MTEILGQPFVYPAPPIVEEQVITIRESPVQRDLRVLNQAIAKYVFFSGFFSMILCLFIILLAWLLFKTRYGKKRLARILGRKEENQKELDP